MANALTIFDQGPLPAHVQAANEIANIIPRAGINALLFEGKVWTINLDGKKTKLLKKDDDGEEQPVAIFTGIILDYTKQRGREYYKGAWDPAKPAMPDCWSEDGVKPEADVADKVSPTCAACPMSKKNSKMTDQGKGTVACSQFRKLAVIPAAQIGAFPPLRLKIKITSDYDKTGADANAATGWYAFQQYLDYLSSKGVRHTTVIPTKIKFDTSVTYPKLLFSPGKAFVPADIWTDTIAPLAASDEVKELLAATYHPSDAAPAGKALPAEEDEEEVTQQAAPAKPAAAKPAATKAGKAAAAPPPPPPAEEEEEEEVTTGVATTTEEESEDEVVLTAEQIAAAKRQAVKDKAAATTNAAVAKAGTVAAKAKAAAQAAPAEEDEETVMTPPVKPAGKAAAAAPKGTPAKAAVNAPADVQGMLEDWDD